MNIFYSLKVKKVRKLTNDAIEISFEIPTELLDMFKFKAGQYITIKSTINNKEVRRAYSICSSPNSEEISVGVKKVKGGKMSTFLTKEIKIGDILEVMPPTGNFIFEEGDVVAICAGSGITPILSMMKLSNSSFTLIYGNKTEDSTMFYSEIKELNNDNHFLFSRENVIGSINGRITSDTLKNINGILDADAYYICGPGKMIDSVSDFLKENEVKGKINFEKFNSPKKSKIENSNSEDSEIISNITVIMDGDEFDYTLSSKGDTILDSAMDEGADVPFSCKGAVCCTCKAKVTEGKAIMDKNYSLSEEEVEDGFILTCQAHPITENIIVDFDEM
ncbi:MAG TPA: FAD-binding oxidoreductase [Flavobacteriales bacterium]|nr:FAD-binding oxidoreductase [Flavobacteriales bacterium]